AVALSPSGALALVTNYRDGTVSVVDTETMTVTSTINVGGAPRAVTVTNDLDGDDSDETAWVTQFFGAPSGSSPETQDNGHKAGWWRSRSPASPPPTRWRSTPSPPASAPPWRTAAPARRWPAARTSCSTWR